MVKFPIQVLLARTSRVVSRCVDSCWAFDGYIDLKTAQRLIRFLFWFHKSSFSCLRFEASIQADNKAIKYMRKSSEEIIYPISISFASQLFFTVDSHARHTAVVDSHHLELSYLAVVDFFSTLYFFIRFSTTCLSTAYIHFAFWFVDISLNGSASMDSRAAR